jgi:probable O-glycosylation ligase (exosortase A-associated)
MKQLLFMIAMEVIGTVGILVEGPFIAVAVYYLFAVGRPQYLWAWSLPRGIQWSNYPAGAAIVGVVAQYFGFIVPRSSGHEPFLGFSRNHAAFLAFALWVCLTYFTALSQSAAWPWLLEYLTIFIMFFVSITVIRSVEQAWILYLTTTIPLLYIAYHINSLYFFDGRMDIYHSGLGGLDNNGAGLTMAMSAPLAIGAWEATKSWWRWGFILSIPLVLHAVLISYSRGAMVSLIAVVPILVFRSTRRWQFAAVVVALLSLVPYLAGKEIRARFFTIADYTEDDSARRRFESWGSALAIAHDYPVFGVGIRNANLVSHVYGADIQGRTIHSQFLQILADEGYVGFFLYVLTLMMFFLGLRRVRRTLRGRQDPAARRSVAMANGLEASLIVFCIGSLFLSLEVFELPYLILLLGAQLALLVTRQPATAGAVIGQHDRPQPSDPHPQFAPVAAGHMNSMLRPPRSTS